LPDWTFFTKGNRQYKEIKGKKRHILVDTSGLLLHAIVHPANIQDRDGGILVMTALFGTFPFLKKPVADSGYQGLEFNQALARVLPHLKAEIVKRSDQAKRFVVSPKRSIVEPAFAWLNRCRRLAKEWENLNRKAPAFPRLASVRLMLRRICNPARSSTTDSKYIAHLGRKRTVEAPWRLIAAVLDDFSPEECQRYPINAGYGSTQNVPL
jgi:transposase